MTSSFVKSLITFEPANVASFVSCLIIFVCLASLALPMATMRFKINFGDRMAIFQWIQGAKNNRNLLSECEEIPKIPLIVFCLSLFRRNETSLTLCRYIG